MAERKIIVVLGTYRTRGEAMRRKDDLLRQGYRKVLIAYIPQQKVWIVYQVITEGSSGGNGAPEAGRSNRK